MYKLRIYGLNAIFGISIQITIGENILTAVATGTAFYIKALPAPPPLKVFRTLEVIDEEDKDLLETQRKLMEKSELNRKKIEECLLNEQSDEEAILLATQDDSSTDSSEGSEHEDQINQTRSRMNKQAMVIEIDDEQDEDLVLFLDDVFNDKFHLCNVDLQNQIYTSDELNEFQMITMVKQKQIDPDHHPNRQLAKIFKSMYQELASQMSYMSSCSVSGISYSVQITKSNCVQIYMNAVVSGRVIPGIAELSLTEENVFELEATTPLASIHSKRTNSMPNIIGNSMDNIPVFEDNTLSREVSVDNEDDFEWETTDTKRQSVITATPSEQNFDQIKSIGEKSRIELTPLLSIPGTTFIRFLGRISLHFIKESNLTYDSYGSSGMGGFCHAFLMELLAVVKAHVLCLGGNAAVGLSIDEIKFDESIKNQGYALLSISGDVIEVQYK
jgi:hypothetical protein